MRVANGKRSEVVIGQLSDVCDGDSCVMDDGWHGTSFNIGHDGIGQGTKYRGVIKLGTVASKDSGNYLEENCEQRSG